MVLEASGDSCEVLREQTVLDASSPTVFVGNIGDPNRFVSLEEGGGALGIYIYIYIFIYIWPIFVIFLFCISMPLCMYLCISVHIRTYEK